MLIAAVIDGQFSRLFMVGMALAILRTIILLMAFSIAPGQGFWVAALNTANTPLDFTTAMRTTTGSGDFIAGPQPLVYKLELKLFQWRDAKAATQVLL